MEQPSYKKPLTLALLLAALSSLVYWFEFKKKPEDQATESMNKKVFALKNPSIRRITLDKGGQPVVLECSGAKNECKPDANTEWILKEPVNVKADPSNAQSLMTSLLGMGSNDSVSLAEESAESRQDLLKSYRLDAASRANTPRVTLETDDGKKVTAYVGEQSPTNSNHYVLVERDGKMDENRVYLAPKYQIAPIDQPLTHWRDKRMVSVPQSGITGFTLKGKSGDVVVDKGAESWTVGTGEKKLTADSDAIDTFLSGIVFLNAKGFEAEKKDSPEAKKLLAGLKPEGSVELRFEEGKQTLRMYSKTFKDAGKTATLAYATVDELDPVFSIDTTALDRLRQNADHFRMKRLLSVNDRGTIDHALFLYPGTKPPQRLVAKRENGEWKRVGEGKAIVNANMNELLDQLSGPVVDQFLPDQTPPLSALILELGPNEKETKLRLKLWKIGKIAFAKNMDSQRKEIFRLDEGVTEVIPFEETLLTEARAKKAPPADPHGHGEDMGHDMHDGEDHSGHGH